MKINFPGIKFVIACTISFIFATSAAQAQNKGVIPFTGLKFFCEGIGTTTIDVKIDGNQLLSNRIPLDRELEIVMYHPTGFVADQNKNIFAGAEVIVLSPKGEILLNDPNVLLKNNAKSFNAVDLKKLSIKFGIGANLMKGNFSGLLKIRLYDTKSKNQIRMEVPVTFAKTGEKLQVSKTVRSIKSGNGVNAFISGLKARDMVIKVDTSIKVAPRMAYTSMDISRIEGSSLSGIFQGKENFWVFDNDLNELKITDILLKQVKGAMENNTIDYTLKIPYRLKNNPAKLYTVRFRWESQDKSQVIDVVVTI